MKAPFACAAAFVAAVASADFSASFADYGEGEGPSSAGIAGGAWLSTPEGSSAVEAAGRKGMRFASGGETAAVFAADAALGGNVRSVDISFCVEELSSEVPDAEFGAAGIAPVDIGGGTFYCLAGGEWMPLAGAGAPRPAVGNWVEARLELRETRTRTFMSYVIGGVRFADAQGRAWFPAEGSVASPSRVEFCGMWTVGGFAGVGADAPEEVAFDVSRPSPGKALEAALTEAADATAEYAWTWERADFGGNWEAAPVSTANACPTDATADAEHFFRVTVMRGDTLVFQDEVFLSPLPVCYMTTDDGVDPVVRKEEHTGRIRIQGNAKWEEQYDGAFTIKVRGNTSAGAEKKPYKIKLEKKTKLLGIPRSKHWVLLANAGDPSLMRNKLAYDFANEVGVLGMESDWVDCVLNGRYVGCYLLCEHIRPDEDRVPVHDWEDDVADKTDLSPINPALTDVSGGYIFEISTENDEVSSFVVKSGNLSFRAMVNAPEYLSSNKAMYDWAKGFMQDYFDACTSADRRSKGLHYSDYCDRDSMVGYLLVQELFANKDAPAKSVYCYKEIGEKLKWGPVWDFDHGSGRNMDFKPEQWWAADKTFYAEWMSDPRFCSAVISRYWRIRGQFATLLEAGGRIDAHAARLALPMAANDARWKSNGPQDIKRMKEFLNRHLAWMDTKMSSRRVLIESTRNGKQTHPCGPPSGILVFIR